MRGRLPEAAQIKAFVVLRSHPFIYFPAFFLTRESLTHVPAPDLAGQPAMKS